VEEGGYEETEGCMMYAGNISDVLYADVTSGMVQTSEGFRECASFDMTTLRHAPSQPVQGMDSAQWRPRRSETCFGMSG
jgi:hypothetical protein